MIRKVFALTLVLTTSTVIASYATPVPENLADVIKPCTTPGALRRLLGVNVFDSADDLYAADLHVDYKGDKYHSLSVIKVQGNTCKELYSDVYVSHEPLSAVIPMETAKQFRLAWEKRQMQRLNDRKATQAWLNGEAVALSSETQWAYRQLGFTVPKKIKTCPGQTPKALYCY